MGLDSPFVSFLEIGHSRLKLGVVRFNDVTGVTLYLFEGYARCIQKGRPLSRYALADAIRCLTDAASDRLSHTINCATILPPANLATSHLVKPSMLLNDGIVSANLVADFREHCGDLINDEDREVIDAEFLSWQIDNQYMHDFPLGRRCQKIEAQALAVAYDKTVLAEYVSACNYAGLRGDGFKSSLLASASFIRRLGIQSNNQVILDIGDSSTSGILQIAKQTSAIFCLAAGSQHMTRDLSVGLQTTEANSEMLKRQIGLTFTYNSRNLLPAGPADGSEFVKCTASNATVIYPWLAPRVAEILDLAKRNFAVYLRALDGGVVIIGGGSQLPGLSGFASQRLPGVKVTVFKPSADGVSAAINAKIVVAQSLDNLAGFESIFGLSQIAIKNRSEDRGTISSGIRLLRPLWTWLGDLSK